MGLGALKEPPQTGWQQRSDGAVVLLGVAPPRFVDTISSGGLARFEPHGKAYSH